MTNIKNNYKTNLENKISDSLGDLKYTNKLKQKHENSIQNLINIIKIYFEYEHGFHCSVESGYGYFCIKPNMDFYNIINKSIDFKFTAWIIADFCDTFQCQLFYFEDCMCKFKFVDPDLKNVFL